MSLAAYTPPMALVFGLHRGTGFVSRAIQLQTRSRYSHVSIVRADGVLLEALQGHGVIAERRLEEVQREERVDVVIVPCTLEQRRRAMAFAQQQADEGKGYDYGSVLRFVSRRQASRKSSGVWFCSELAFAAAREGGLTLLGATEPWEVSPGLFARSPLLRWPLGADVAGRVQHDLSYPAVPFPLPALP